MRLGNGIEVSGNSTDVIVEDCRIHQAYDTGVDPQNVGPSPVTQRGLVFRNNLVSHVGLAGFELWARPSGSRLSDVRLEHNTVLYAGRGWGYEQHDHVGQGRVGAALAVFQNLAAGDGIVIGNNVFADPRVALMSEFRVDQQATRGFLRGLAMDGNLWSLGAGGVGVVLFEGTTDAMGNTVLGASPVFPDLAAWRSPQNLDVPGMDVNSVQADPEFDAPTDAVTQDRAWIAGLPPGDLARPSRFGRFALTGDYRRSGASRGIGWGASLAP
ncbi:MAG: right-handed parallel beta-helix repeat-containing protein [Deltaproteobacteria bacterium]